LIVTEVPINPIIRTRTHHYHHEYYPPHDDINIDLREIGWDGMGWINLAQDRDQWRALVNMVMNL
jgi:hypothetical protein